MWLRALFNDLGYGDLSAETYGSLCDVDYRRVRLSAMTDPFETAIMLQGDNKAAIQTAKNPVNHKRMKHIHNAFGLTREAVQAKLVAPCYIGTNDNTADIMTKELETQLHRRHTNRMMAGLDNGKFVDITGKVLDWKAKTPNRDKLYLTEATGLGKASKVATEKLMEICDNLGLIQTVRRAEPKAGGTEGQPAGSILTGILEKLQKFRKEPVQKKNVSMLDGIIKKVRQLQKQAKRADWMGPRTATAHRSMPPIAVAAHVAARKKLGECIRSIATRVEATAMRKVVEVALSAAKRALAGALERALSAWASRCIIDSGASHTYCTGDVPLTNVRPGHGHVTVATGKHEKIVEFGELGALKDVRRVASFTRTLVSVRDLVEQFGSVRFDETGAHIVDPSGEVSTCIGRPTCNRLYSFDGAALMEHTRRVALRCR